MSDPELQAALDAIASGPGDDGRKQVLADLLLERGDPRGEFLLLQFLIAANQASSAMRKQADELWRRHKRAWLQGVQALLTEVRLERGFPVAATLAPRTTPQQVKEAVASPMFSTLRRLEGPLAVEALLEAAAHPRMHELTELGLPNRDALEALAARGVPGRLRRLEIPFALEPSDVELLVRAPVFSRLEFLACGVGDGARRPGDRARLRAPAPPAELVPLLTVLSTHPVLRKLSLGGLGFGHHGRFVEVAAAWAKLRFTSLVAPGSFELSRAEDGTEVTLMNLSGEVMAGLRRHLPAGTVRVRLMPQRDWKANLDRDALLAAFVGLDVKTLP